MKTLIEILLDNLEPIIEIQLVKIKEWHIRKDLTFTEFDSEMARLGLVFKIVSSFEKYTSQGDELSRIMDVNNSHGNLTINSSVKRGGIEYSFNTEVVYAGGYNIQCFHIRYITKTNIPKTGNRSLTDTLNNRIKGLNKLKRIEKEIKLYESYLLREESKLNQLLGLTTETQILEMSSNWNLYYSDIDKCWGNIVKNSTTKNFGSKDDFIKERDIFKNKLISSHEYSIVYTRNYICTLKNQIKKFEEKYKDVGISIH